MAKALQGISGRILPLLILGVAVGGFMALRATRPTTSPVQIEEKAWQVHAIQVTPGPHTPDLLIYGSVEAPRQVDLSAAVTADAAQVLAVEGQQVKAGQTLVILDDRDIELTLRQRQADVAEIQALIGSEHKRYQSDRDALERERALLALNRKAMDRAEDLTRRQMGSESLLDEARMALERQALAVNARQLVVDDHSARLAQLQARLARAEALRDQALLDQQRTRINAPFAGRITRVPIATGDRARVGDLLVQLYSTDDLEIRAQIPFRHLSALRAALNDHQTLTASAAINGHSLQAKLDRLSGKAAKDAGGIDALFDILHGTGDVVPGRLLPLILNLLPQEQTVALPPDALYGLNRIYRLQDGRMMALEVDRIGERRSSDGAVQVLVRSSELQAGDRIITTQLPNAVSGLKVTVTP